MSSSSSESLNSNRDDISLEDVTIICHKLFPTRYVKILDYHTKPFSEEPFGFLSIHDQLIVKALDHDAPQSKRKKITLSFFVKRRLSSPDAFQTLIFDEESKFFRDAVPQLIKDFKGESWTAKCYLVKNDLMIMEDLRSQGFNVPGDQLTDRQLISAVACLARLHASSMLLESKLRKPLNEVYSGYFKEKLLQEEGFNIKWLLAGIETVEAAALDFGLEPKYALEACESTLNCAQPVVGERNVLSHGDIWSNNMMFRDEQDGTTISCRLVDFQMVAYRLYVVDLVQFLYLNSNRATRRRMENELVQVYHEALNEHLQIHYYRGRMISLQKMMDDLREKRVFGLVSAALIYPIALMSKELKDQYTEDAEKFQGYMYVSRKDFVRRACRIDRNYRNRIKENLIELTELMQSH